MNLLGLHNKQNGVSATPTDVNHVQLVSTTLYTIRQTRQSRIVVG